MDEFNQQLAAKVISQLIIKSSSHIWSQGVRLGKYTQKEIEKILYQLSGEYARKYNELYGSIKILGMSEPWNLDEIYVKVKLLDKEMVREYNSSKIQDEFQERIAEESQDSLIEGFTAVNKFSKIMILGYPGNGKTTFLRKIALEALKGSKGELKFDSFPVLIELRKYKSFKNSLKDMIIEKFEILGFPEAKASVYRLLRDGKMLILLDGFDEIPESEMKAAFDHIQDFIEKFDENRFVISCRINVYNDGYSFPNFKDIKIAFFQENQIQSFVNSWFGKEGKQDLVPEFLEELKKNHASYELAKTPVLLTLICLMYNKNFRIPQQQNELYKESIDVWLERWWKTKQTEDNSFAIDPYDEKILLSELAYNKFKSKKIFFSYRELIQEIDRFLVSKKKFSGISSDSFLKKDLMRKQGIIVNRVSDEYSFSHLTFQEYFVADFIYSRSSSLGEDLLSKTISVYGKNKKWRYVFILLAGFIQDPVAIKVFIEKLANQLPHAQDSKKLRIIFKACIKMIEEKQTHLPFQLRLIYSIYFVLLYALLSFTGYSERNNLEEVLGSLQDDYIRHFASFTKSFIARYSIDKRFPKNHSYQRFFDFNQNVLWQLNQGYACNKSIKFFESIEKERLFSLDIKKILILLRDVKYRMSLKKTPPDFQESQVISSIVLSEVGLSELSDWKGSDIEDLYHIVQDYFYIYTLMIECKESASSVIRNDDWNRIEERIFR